MVQLKFSQSSFNICPTYAPKPEKLFAPKTNMQIARIVLKQTWKPNKQE